ncbi:MAG: hypothetical protein P1U88_00045 [Thalassobaculaceae bacterium]|nr:hypothetical protein [Thalassobaculaceae bacterium]
MTRMPALPPLFAAALLAAGLSDPVAAQTPLPSNVLDSCIVSKSEFDSWKAATPGVFQAADSITFSDANDCNFFKWGAQMFLWLTSQPDGQLVFDGPDFFGVAKNDQGKRVFVPQGSNNYTMQLEPRVVKPQNDTSVGQAGGGGVLISPQGEIVHYGINANNVYAYYQTGVESPTNPAHFQGELATDFPTTQSDLNAITRYAQSTLGVSSIPSSQALAMELKTSWVDAASLDNPEDYVTADAVVAVFNHTTPTTWVQIGTAVRRMALVGFHIVGSVNNHPEMVWATFEHIDNAPQNGFVYITTFGIPAVEPYDGNGTAKWLFNATPRAPRTPVLHVQERAAYKTISQFGTKINVIKADTGETIGPNTVVRVNPWGDEPFVGAAQTAAEYGGSSSAVSRTTDLISLNRSVIGWIGNRDVRSKYIQTGSIWSKGGPDAIPVCGPTQNENICGTDPNLRGTLALANATMETFHQFPDTPPGSTFKPKNCFGCHFVNTSSSPSQGVSHIFSSLVPLTPN